MAGNTGFPQPVADRDAHDQPALGCAAPTAVIAAVQGFAARHGYALTGIEADFIATYNRLRSRFREADGEPAALAVVLFIFVTPLIVFNIIQIRKQREIR